MVGVRGAVALIREEADQHGAARFEVVNRQPQRGTTGLRARDEALLDAELDVGVVSNA